MSSAITIGGSGSGKTSALRVMAVHLSTATADTARGRRLRGLLAELEEITADRRMARRYVQRGTWLDELVTEEQDVWGHIFEAVTGANPANGADMRKAEQK